MTDGIKKQDEEPASGYFMDWEWERNAERKQRIYGEYSLHGIFVHRSKGPTGRSRTSKHRLGKIPAELIYIQGQRLAFWTRAEEKMQAMGLDETAKITICSQIAEMVRPLTEDEVSAHKSEAEEAAEHLKRLFHNKGNAEDFIWLELFKKEGQIETGP